MTKAELLAALEPLPLDAEILATALPKTNNVDALFDARNDLTDGYSTELSVVSGVDIHDGNAGEYNAFAVLKHDMEYLDIPEVKQ